MERFVMPDLYCPFAPAINEHAEAVEEGTVQWALSFGLLPDERSVRTFRAAAMGHLAARTYPHLGLEELSLISDWYSWLFFRDDQRDEGTEVGRSPGELSGLDRRLLAILEGADVSAEDEPMAGAMLDLRERVDERVRSNRLRIFPKRRFVRALTEHLEATAWEAQNRARETVPAPDSYIRMSRLTGGLFVITTLIEIIENMHLPQEVHEHPVVRRLTIASDNVVCWSNDLVSLKKELACGDVHNLVVVLSHAEGLSLQETIDLTIEMHNAEVYTFVDIEQRLPSFAPKVDVALASYVASLRDRMRGHLDWLHQTARYGASHTLLTNY